MGRKRIIDCYNHNGQNLICYQNSHPQCRLCKRCKNHNNCENCEDRCPDCHADCTKCHLNCANRRAHYKVF